MKATETIIAEIAERGYITEKEISLLKCRSNRSSCFVPVYRCGAMEYYVLGGKINVVG